MYVSTMTPMLNDTADQRRAKREARRQHFNEKRTQRHGRVRLDADDLDCEDDDQ